jgi:hypothetical protein
MGGKITLESKGINQGTTVSIILPLIDTHQENTEDGENSRVGELNSLSQKPKLSNDLCSIQQVCHSG